MHWCARQGDKTVYGLPCTVADKLLVLDNVEFATRRTEESSQWPFLIKRSTRDKTVYRPGR